MIHLGSAKYDKYGTPVLKNSDIESYAEAVIADFDASILKEPTKFPFERFLEYYLGLTLIYSDIYYDKDAKQILGAAVFEDGYIKIFNKTKMTVDNLYVQANSVILDNTLKHNRQEGRLLFTALHESGHFLLHPLMYHVGMIMQAKLSPVLLCERDSIEITKEKDFEKSGGWKEYQADYFASCLAMPNKTVVPLLREVMDFNGYYEDIIEYHNSGDQNYFFVANTLTNLLMYKYGVSKRSAQLKIKKLGIIRKADPIVTDEEKKLIERYILGE